jgi:hypothetical protein
MDLKKELENIKIEDWKVDDLFDLKDIIQKKIDQRLQLIIMGDYEGRTT